MASKMRLDEAYALINAEREKEREQARAKALAFVGRFFKTRNSYGGDCDGWWLYAAATTVTDYGFLEGFEFQWKKDKSHDSIEISADTMLITLLNNSGGWKEISKEEFDAAFSSVVSAAMELRQAADAVARSGGDGTDRPRALTALSSNLSEVVAPPDTESR